jgi:uncharacterized protein (DUF58 family)
VTARAENPSTAAAQVQTHPRAAQATLATSEGRPAPVADLAADPAGRGVASARGSSVSRARTPSWRRRLGFTRIGRWYVAFTIGVGLAAVNTGNNLLFLVLGLLLSSIIVSGILAESSIKGIDVERRLPDVAIAGHPALIGIAVKNRKTRSPSFSLEIRERGGDVSGNAFLVLLPPSATQEANYRFTPERRGLHRLEQIEVVTRAPFGLFEKSRPIDAPSELIVFPRKVTPPEADLDRLMRQGDEGTSRVGIGQEVHGLRDHRPGEDMRAIHWRTSARIGRLIGIDREQERRRRVCVVLDQRGLSGDALERAIEDAAALFERELDEGGDAGIAVPGETLPAASGSSHRFAGLSLLALLDGGEGRSAPVPDPYASSLYVLGRA